MLMLIQHKRKTNMAEEEKDNNTTMTSDDMNALRVLLQNVKGISAVSSTTLYVPVDDQRTDS